MSRTTIPPALLAIALLAAPAARAADSPAIRYNRDIRPILAENCFACHGPDSASRKGDLRLDRREAAVEAGAITPGDPDGSELIARIASDDRTQLMPPASSHKTLTPQQKDLLARWIKAGAEYQAHWSLIPPVRPAPPKVKDEAWVRNPIDRFVLAKLEEAGLRPAPEADRRTLIRRLSLDLTGLPPEPAEVERFARDASPDAYARLVDHLLDSPRWGEHRARYWLDAARYADTHGYHFDNYREMYSYRDWVIDAFNRNMPFDRFTVEQLAGDLLPDRTLDQLIASGFNRCNATTNEGGTIAEENLANYTRDRTETFAQVWLGLTAGCAVCHDHKFDPLPQRDFYELSAFFNNSTQGAYDGNVKDTPPVIAVPAAADRARYQALKPRAADLKGQIERRSAQALPELEAWLKAQDRDALASLAPEGGRRLVVGLEARTGQGGRGGPKGTTPARPAFESADAGDFERDRPFAYGAWIRIDRGGQYGSVLARMDNRGGGYRGWDLWVEGDKVAAHLVHSWADDAAKVVSREGVPMKTWIHVFVTYDGSSKASGLKLYIDGRPAATDVAADTLKGTIRTGVPLKIGQRHAGQGLDAVAISDVRIHDRAIGDAEVAGIAAAGRALDLRDDPAGPRAEALRDGLLAWWTDARDARSRGLKAELARVEEELDAIRSRGTVAHVMEEKPGPATAYVLFRGEYDKRRDAVTAGTPDVLPPMPADLPRNRLGLARWLLRPENPLTARVTVNRFWQEVFGSGLVATAGDFGVSGELPSHPELLDWLAVEFRESGWDVKRLFRLIANSSAYRQAGVATPEKLEKDPQGRLLSRGPRFRLDGEVVRDYALAAGGLLSAKVGGPSVRPYQPDGVWEAVAMPESNTKSYRADAGEGLHRRSLYTFWKRSAPPASLEVFNAPSREVCTVRRERTNTPLQALVTLNDPQFVEAARGLALLALALPSADPEARVSLLAERLLARPLRPEEMAVVRASVDRLAAFYRSHPEDATKLLAVGELRPPAGVDPPTLAAWTMLANEMMNLDEVLNK
ncbi:Planctomycete cytochrome C [Aquisphaera giovannonii]|uniref:Planctomycete cytochrome C n=1 Tax=Aquisphaera giovannonii TaxID=406548 RepID=A0A5B9WFG8_9BACT|nr:DUF1553 domain-containing protein [Aquisphaera giovannonii]QEH38815.1 Planctomycete cytochrome C [Aquisphaera giovannonii]